MFVHGLAVEMWARTMPAATGPRRHRFGVVGGNGAAARWLLAGGAGQVDGRASTRIGAATSIAGTTVGAGSGCHARPVPRSPQADTSGAITTAGAHRSPTRLRPPRAAETCCSRAAKKTHADTLHTGRGPRLGHHRSRSGGQGRHCRGARRERRRNRLDGRTRSWATPERVQSTPARRVAMPARQPGIAHERAQRARTSAGEMASRLG